MTIGDYPHLTAAYTSGRGTATNAIDGASFSVPAGTKHVKVIFTAESGWRIVGNGAVEINTVAKDIVFGEESGYKVPKVVIDGPSVSPGESLGPYETAAEATNVMSTAKFAPSVEVEAKLGKGSDALETYCDMFGLGVVPTSDGKWAVAAFLTPPNWTNVVESAQEATRQIPVADIAALPLYTPTNVTAKGCGVPGFYYSFYSGSSVTNLGAIADEKGRNVLCGPSKDVEFSGVVKPSDEAGFFTIGVGETPGVQPSDRAELEPPATMGSQSEW